MKLWKCSDWVLCNCRKHSESTACLKSTSRPSATSTPSLTMWSFCSHWKAIRRDASRQTSPVMLPNPRTYLQLHHNCIRDLLIMSRAFQSCFPTSFAFCLYFFPKRPFVPGYSFIKTSKWICKRNRAFCTSVLYLFEFFFGIFFMRCLMIFIEAKTLAVSGLVGLSYMSLGFVWKHTQTRRHSARVTLNSQTPQLLSCTIYSLGIKDLFAPTMRNRFVITGHKNTFNPQQLAF